MKRIKQFYKISKKGNKKKQSCHLVPKVVIGLPFEGRKEGRRKPEMQKKGESSKGRK